MEILKHPNETLKKLAEPVTVFDDELREFIKEMFMTLDATDFGVALAANQVGVPKMIAVFDIKEHCGGTGKLVLINPKIETATDLSLKPEGCLSLPHIWENIERYEHVLVTGQDAHGNPVEMLTKDMLAQAIQHEIDHFNGKCLLDKLSADRRKVLERQIRRAKK